MATTFPFEVGYCKDLFELSDVLLGVQRAGTFATSGDLLCPLPGVSIDGVGQLAFPLQATQARQIAKVAEQAPYGKGEKTLVDTKVRRVKQISPGKFSIGGKAWDDTLDSILSKCVKGLGIDFEVDLDLYKLLLYEKGSFFAPHRDTEKAKGMFGTMIVSFPSQHTGGELIVRHQTGDEVGVNLLAEDSSELRFAAFYADCEHEVTPITSGFRMCLVYNMIRKTSGKRKRETSSYDDRSVDYTNQIRQVASVLREWKGRKDRSPKIAWLLEHDYTPENLSFAGLKLQDAGRGHVMLQAAIEAECSVHLGLVHIEESGIAEVYGGYYGRYSGFGEDVGDGEDYELIEAYDGSQYVGDWVDSDDRRVNYGEIPLGEDELLPEGALQDEDPDEIRVSEATGNEGGSYERFYYRSALVIWPENETGTVLMQAGPQSVVPYFAKLVNQPDKKREAAEIESLAKTITTEWDVSKGQFYRSNSEEIQSVAEMLESLNRHGKGVLIAKFAKRVVCNRFGEKVITPLNEALKIVTVAKGKEIVKSLVQTNCTDSFVELSLWFESAVNERLPPSALRAAAEEMQVCLPKLKPINKKPKVPFKHRNNYWGTQKDEKKDSTEKDRGDALGRWIVSTNQVLRSKSLVTALTKEAIKEKSK